MNDKAHSEKKLSDLANQVFSHPYKFEDLPALKELYLKIKDLNEDAADASISSVTKDMSNFAEKKKKFYQKSKKLAVV